LESPTAGPVTASGSPTPIIGNGGSVGGGSGGGASAASGFYVNSGLTLVLSLVAMFLLLA
jgi:hypothetical protein